MELRRPTVPLIAALLAGGALLAGCGGSDDPSGTVNDAISVGTGQDSVDVGGNTAGGGGESSAAESSGGGESSQGGGGQGDAAAGKTVFTGAAGCTGCHTLKDAGASGNVGPNLDDAKPDYDTVVKFVTDGAPPMPAFKGTLSDTDIQNVAAYVSSVAGK